MVDLEAYLKSLSQEQQLRIKIIYEELIEEIMCQSPKPKRRCSICGSIRTVINLNRHRNYRGCMVENIYYCYDIGDCVGKSKTFSFVWNDNGKNL